MPQPLAKGLRGLLRGGTTTSDALPLEDMPIGTTATNDDIGAAGYDSIVFNFSGVLKEAPLGENPLRDATKQVSLLRVEEARLQRAKMLEERKGKNANQNQARLFKELVETRDYFAKKAVEEVSAAPQNVFSWVESFWKQEEKVVEEEKVVKKKYSKNAELASEAGRNAREAAARAREELDKARMSMREAHKSARSARNMDQEKRVKHIIVDEETIVQKPLSMLEIKLFDGKNFPVFGDTLRGKACLAYAKVLLRDPKADPEVEPRTHYSSTQHTTDGKFEWLQEFKFIVAADWDDEERPEIVEFTFYREAKTLIGKSKQDPENDEELGHYSIRLNEFVKLQPTHRFPDGREIKGSFEGTLTKWFKLHDRQGKPVEGLQESDDSPSFQAEMKYTDSNDMKKTWNNTVKAIKLPARPPYRGPAPRPPATWKDHPDWVKNHGPGICTCCEFRSETKSRSTPRGSRLATPRPDGSKEGSSNHNG